MLLRCATFNVLADAYIRNNDYSHTSPVLLEAGARTRGIVRLIDDLQADVVGIQEAETPLVRALSETNQWQSFWSPKERNMRDGCLTIVKHGIETSDFETHPYSDRSGYIFQSIRIGKTIFANTHIKWAHDDEPEHPGVSQITELLGQLGLNQGAVILADCNDRPNGPVKKLIKEAGFANLGGDKETALIKQMPAALDIIAVRGVFGE